MFYTKWSSLSKILDESPFFTGLSVEEREKLIQELVETYPQLCQQIPGDVDVGYEASWLMEQS
ncbi:MAG TPA: hypothetical protein ENG83_02780 [Nitrospirae bacterium]|nr:hypothetical protein BMS3Abin06_00976 [bacterium BMS3Abin06]HDH11121.1 hypothetical protein [Nitrospirota bacterium]HDZ02522.1 hypothetical protein [Nitrospirota bacterium]